MIKGYKISDFPLSLTYFSPRPDFLSGWVVSWFEPICSRRKSGCIIYFLLHNKLTQYWEAENNKHLWPHSFFGSGIWEEFSWMVLSRVLSWSCSQDIGWVFSRLRGGHLRKISLRAGSLPWLLAAGLSSPACKLPHRALWVPSCHGSWLPSECVIKMNVRRKPHHLSCPNFRSHTVSLSLLPHFFS